MTIQTERLELILLTSSQLELWTRDAAALEKELHCSYQAEPLEGHFLEVLKLCSAAAQSDPGNDLWHSFFWIVRRIDGVVVGSADFKGRPNGNGEVEIGYGLGKAFEHAGYMTETVKALCEFVLSQEGVAAVLAETDSEGYGSQRVLTRCGFQKEREAGTVWWRL